MSENMFIFIVWAISAIGFFASGASVGRGLERIIWTSLLTDNLHQKTVAKLLERYRGDAK